MDDLGFKQKARELVLLSKKLEKAADEAGKFCKELTSSLGIEVSWLCFFFFFF